MTLTVIIVTYNRLPLLPLAIRSVKRQAADLPLPLDILVVDDGSTDGTADWLAAQRQPGLRFVTQPNRGVTAARNAGLQALLAETTFVTFLDSDDISPPQALARQLADLRADPALDLVYGRMTMVDDISPQTLEPAADARRLDLVGIHLSCALFRRALIDRIGPFDPAFRQAEDTDYLLRTFEAGTRFRQTATVCLYYRRHAGNMTKRQEESRRYFALAIHKSLVRRRRDPTIRLDKPCFDIQSLGSTEFW
ncbi:glycosyltransferase family 2 protein [Fuscibacter oryzae]|uniref:Glycosyltransferase n=1 Tax=Fuscibacter oryzae TaxID=2803939 RepID=A0A8J7MW76_9RHOB|nr:glycosyltransferase [Fuscibacter oryzae]MBL4929009.1 glycosyltransferase [Fuscibacter oryzae]